MSGSTFGHYANEEDQPEPLCSSCGEYHPPGPCPGEEPEDWPLPAEPEWVADPARPESRSWSMNKCRCAPPAIDPAPQALG